MGQLVSTGWPSHRSTIVVLLRAVVLHQAQLGFFPVDAVPADGIAESPAPVQTALGLVPHAQLAIDLDDGAVEDDLLVVRFARTSTTYDYGRFVVRRLPRNQLQPQSRAERDAVIIEGKQHGFINRGIGNTVLHFQHGFKPPVLIPSFYCRLHGNSSTSEAHRS